MMNESFNMISLLKETSSKFSKITSLMHLPLDSEVAPVVDHSHLPVASDQTHRPAEAEEADESSEPPEELLEYEVEELEEELEEELDDAEFLDPEFL